MEARLLEQLRNITREEQEILDGRTQIDKTLYMSEDPMTIDSKRLLDSGKLIEVRPHTRFLAFPKHKHNYVELIYMCQGKTKHKIEGQEVELCQGELLFLNQHVTQEVARAEETDIAVNFIIRPEFFDTALHMMGEEDNLMRDFIIGCLCNDADDSKYSSYLHFKVADILPIQNLVENLIWTLWNNQANKRSMNQITMGLLFLQLMNHTDKLVVGQDNLEQELVFTVLRYIEEHYREGKLSDLAGQLKYDLYWLSRTIKQLTGHNYTELLQIKRLNQAVFLLTSSKMPVADIALATGYSNISYFHRIFKERYGMTPREYRLENREK
ncbi:MAG: AraC family transcriptional regulator [Lachnospiraceae bacterium]